MELAIRPLRFFDTLISMFKKESTSTEVDLTIPNNILYRTELMCSYISSENKVEFGIENFLMVLYMDFIKNSIKHYNPERTFKELTRKHEYKSEIVLMINGEREVYTEIKQECSTVEIEIENEELKKGQLILDELYDIYRYRISMNSLLSSLWINFIEDYKKGENKRAYTQIMKILRECLGADE